MSDSRPSRLPARLSDRFSLFVRVSSRRLPMIPAERLRARTLAHNTVGDFKIGLTPITEKHNDAAARVVIYHMFEVAKDIWKRGYMRHSHRSQLNRLREALPRAKSLHSDFAAYAREIATSAEEAFQRLALRDAIDPEERQSAFAFFVCACELAAHDPALQPSFGIVGMYAMCVPTRLSGFVNECLDMIAE